MFERLLVLAVLVLAFVGTVVAIRLWLRRSQGLQERSATGLWPALGERSDGRPGLVVFSTPSCVACRTAQQPAVEVVAAQLGTRLRVLHVDIAERPDAARAFRILTAPSTVVLAPDGRVSAVNQGFARAEVLGVQVIAAGAGPAMLPSPRPPAAPAPQAPAPAGHR